MNRLLWACAILGKNKTYNLVNLLKKRGCLILRDNIKICFNKENEKDIKNLFIFNQFYGVKFLDKEGYWHHSDNVHRRS